MWTHEQSIETSATPAQIWKIFSDVAGWKNWNAGIERIAIHGPFAKGTTFSMQPPGEDAFTSQLLDVEENVAFTDETLINGMRVLVHHRIACLDTGRTKIIFSTEITGEGAREFGPMVTADFPAVLGALKALAESR